MKKLQLLALSLLLTATTTLAQFTKGWTPHLSYRDGTACVRSGGYVYALLGENLLIYNVAEQSAQPIDRFNTALAAKRIVQMGYSARHKVLVLVYADCNIDLYYPLSGRIVHLPQLTQSLTTTFEPQQLTVQPDDAFLTTRTGFAWIDLTRETLRGHFTMANAHTVTRAGQQLYVATDQGLRTASIYGNLADPQQWTLLLGGQFQLCLATENHLYLAGQLAGTTDKGLLRLALASRAATPTAPLTAADLQRLNYHVVLSAHLDSEGQLLAHLDTHDLLIDNPTQGTTTLQPLPPTTTCYESDGRGGLWLGAEGQAIRHLPATALAQLNVTAPQGFDAQIGGWGPQLDKGYFLRQDGEQLLVASGRLDPYDREDIPQTAMIFKDKEWLIFQRPQEGEGYHGWKFHNATSIVRRGEAPNTRYFVSTGRTGVYEHDAQGKIVRQYSENNSPLRSATTDAYWHPNYVRTDGLLTDAQGNVFVLNCSSDTAVQVLQPSGRWQGLYVEALRQTPTLEKALFDRKGRLWITSRRTTQTQDAGFLCLDYGGTIAQTGDDVATYRSSFTNQDGAHCAFTMALAMAEDANGAMWLGTDAGLFVVDNTDLWPRNDFRITQIKVARNDGTDYADYLLDKVVVTAIAVDPANRKWVGTAENGLYLFSENGEQTIAHFTMDNSPLFSNNIWSIACHPSNGEVMISTDAGMLSYRGEATTPVGQLTSSQVRVFPNPLRPTDPLRVTLTGLESDTEITVVNAAGQAVARGMSLGGSFVWDARTQQGLSVPSGIYSFYMVTPQGERTAVASVAVVR